MHGSEDGGESLLHDAAQLLAANRTAHGFTRPSADQYPHQWNWDSAFISIGLDHLEPTAAREEIRALLRGQWRSGLIPHIVYHGESSNYFPTPEFWQTTALGTGTGVVTSGLTQPPLLATALRHHVEVAGDSGLAFAAEVFDSVTAWHRWLRRARDPEGTGLVAIIHPWEAGTDDSSRFREPLRRLGTFEPPSYQRRDQRFVSPEERPVADDYDRFIYLIGRYRELGWSDDLLYRQAPFLVRDVLFNSILHAADQDLWWLARRLGRPTAEIDEWLAATGRAIREQLWSEEEGLFFDLDVRAGAPVRENTIASLSPLYSGAATVEQADRLVERLEDDRYYWRGGGTRYLVPTVSKSSRHFEPRRYWRGPVWLNLNWLLIRGLRRYGMEETADSVRSDSLELVGRSGFAEYYDPRDGSACGARRFSWSAALIVDLMNE